jgi:hypothetical protein
MQLLAHRGMWDDPATKNSPESLKQALENGFGIETDFRDFTDAEGQLRIAVSHDPLSGTNPLLASEFIETLLRLNPSAPVAFNIKADGLQSLLTALVPSAVWQHSFVFDMSVPDTIQWLKTDVPVFVRHSEVEPDPVLLSNKGVKGIWLDAFYDQWWDSGTIEAHLEAGRRVAIVSPELHTRAYEEMWESIATAELHTSDDVLLCTDLPNEARKFFGLT